LKTKTKTTSFASFSFEKKKQLARSPAFFWSAVKTSRDVKKSDFLPDLKGNY